ncbi:PIN domain-containing protein, partial [Acinetobacter baumannii]
ARDQHAPAAASSTSSSGNPHKKDQATSTSGNRRASNGKKTVRKLFVLDTNVLMHDPASLFRFEEHDVYLPMMTLEELD